MSSITKTSAAMVINRNKHIQEDMKTDIIGLVSNSCSCDRETAEEYLASEVRNLQELQELDDLRGDDIELACSNLGLDLDCMEYFVHRLAGC